MHILMYGSDRRTYLPIVLAYKSESITARGHEPTGGGDGRCEPKIPRDVRDLFITSPDGWPGFVRRAAQAHE